MVTIGVLVLDTWSQNGRARIFDGGDVWLLLAGDGNPHAGGARFDWYPRDLDATSVVMLHEMCAR